jgi:hypothetical protein
MIKSQIDCTKWHKCSANICPLDQHWRKRTHLDDDRVCSYILESGKLDAEAVFRGRGRGDVYDSIREVIPDILSRHPRINRAYERAMLTSSRMDRMDFKTEEEVIH